MPSSSATLTDCSTSRIVVPERATSRTISASRDTIDRCQSEAQLVDDQEAGPGQERHGQCQHLLLPTGQVDRRLVLPAGEGREHLEHLDDPPFLFGAIGPQQPPGRPQVLAHRERREDAVARPASG